MSVGPWSVLSVYLAPCGREQGNHLQPKKGACSPSRVLSIRKYLLAVGDQHTLQTLILLYFFSFLCIKHCSNEQLMCWVLLGHPEPVENAVGPGLWAPISGDWHHYDLCHPPCNGNHHLGLVAGSFCLISNKCALLHKSQRDKNVCSTHTHTYKLYMIIKNFVICISQKLEKKNCPTISEFLNKLCTSITCNYSQQ